MEEKTSWIATEDAETSFSNDPIVMLSGFPSDNQPTESIDY